MSAVLGSSSATMNWNRLLPLCCALGLVTPVRAGPDGGQGLIGDAPLGGIVLPADSVIGLSTRARVETKLSDLELKVVDLPLEVDAPTPLACRPLPACAAEALSAAAERPLGVMAWNGRGVVPSHPGRERTAAGYVDVSKRAWVPLELSEDDVGFAGEGVRDDSRTIRLLGHRKSPLVALGVAPDHTSTVEGFGADFTSWRVVDLVRQRVLLELDSHRGEVRSVGPGTRVRIRTYHWALPAECPEGGPRERVFGGRAAPLLAVEATWDLATVKRLTPFEAWSDDFERGVRRLGRCGGDR